MTVEVPGMMKTAVRVPQLGALQALGKLFSRGRRAVTRGRMGANLDPRGILSAALRRGTGTGVRAAAAPLLGATIGGLGTGWEDPSKAWEGALLGALLGAPAMAIGARGRGVTPFLAQQLAAAFPAAAIGFHPRYAKRGSDETILKIAKKDMPSFTKQDRPKKVKDIYRALKRDHPSMPAEMKARIASRQGKPGKQKQGPPYKAPLTKKKEKSSMEKRSYLPGTTLGALIGLLRERELGEDRLQAAGRSAMTGLGTDAGMIGGGGLGAILGALLASRKGGIHPLTGALIGGVPGAALGGTAGYFATRRNPEERVRARLKNLQEQQKLIEDNDERPKAAMDKALDAVMEKHAVTTPFSREDISGAEKSLTGGLTDWLERLNMPGGHEISRFIKQKPSIAYGLGGGGLGALLGALLNLRSPGTGALTGALAGGGLGASLGASSEYIPWLRKHWWAPAAGGLGLAALSSLLQPGRPKMAGEKTSRLSTEEIGFPLAGAGIGAGAGLLSTGLSRKRSLQEAIARMLLGSVGGAGAGMATYSGMELGGGQSYLRDLVKTLLGGGAGALTGVRLLSSDPLTGEERPKTAMEKTAVLGRAIRGLGGRIAGGGMNLLRRGAGMPGWGGLWRQMLGRMGTGTGGFMQAHPYLSLLGAGTAAAVPFQKQLMGLFRGGGVPSKIEENMAERRRLMTNPIP